MAAFLLQLTASLVPKLALFRLATKLNLKNLKCCVIVTKTIKAKFYIIKAPTSLHRVSKYLIILIMQLCLFVVDTQAGVSGI